MSATWGNRIKLTVFGESHGVAIGGVIDGLKPGWPLDLEAIAIQMQRRAPGQNKLSTTRTEADAVEILSGIYNGKTTGTPLAFTIKNTDTRSADYQCFSQVPRPGHADYTGSVKYKGFADPRGGGHFSGRLTAVLVFAGAIARQILETQNIEILSHVKSIGATAECLDTEDIAVWRSLSGHTLPVKDPELLEKMLFSVEAAKLSKDSLGGVVECIVFGLKAGVGNPFFNSIESQLSSLLFSIPAVKGVSFGDGFNITTLKGSESNDAMALSAGEVHHTSNHNGGILGGISNGMPLRLAVAIKPTPSIAKAQMTLDRAQKSMTALEIKGRHDPCIVPRAIPVVEAVVALGLLDFLMDEV